jgi:hypothetical protein
LAPGTGIYKAIDQGERSPWVYLVEVVPTAFVVVVDMQGQASAGLARSIGEFDQIAGLFGARPLMVPHPYSARFHHGRASRVVPEQE